MIQISQSKLDDVRQATNEDQELSALREQVTIGWPEKVKQVTSPVRPYWSMHDHIGVKNVLIFKGQRLIIPKSL